MGLIDLLHKPEGKTLEFKRDLSSPVAEMRHFANREKLDEGPMPELDSEAIDFRAASESFAEFRRLKV